MLALALTALPASAHAEWQLKPFGGITFGGASPFVDLDRVAGKAKLNLGVGAVWLGEVFGLEGEVATTSGFFTGSALNIPRSHVATMDGNVVVALPRRLAGYSLRPYGVTGLGLAQVSFQEKFGAYVFSRALSAWNVGGGATGFVSNTIGVNWEVRLFRTLQAQNPDSTSAVVENKRLSFWRATMGFAIRL